MRRAVPRPVRVLLGAFLVLVAGCHVGRGMIATSGDYADYRSIRLAPNLDERLAAAWYYLQHRPDGRFAERVRRYFVSAEEVFWAAHGRDEAGLAEYLRALPSGPHADEALEKLMRLRGERRRNVVRGFDSERAQQRLDAAAANRRAAARLAIRWLRLLVDPASWDGPFTEAPGPLLVAYRKELPAPDCVREEATAIYRCTKVVQRTFDVVVEGESVDRGVLLWLELSLDDGWRLQSAQLLGPSLFVRHVEASRRRPVAEGDEQGRAEAVEQFQQWAMEALADPALDCTPVESSVGLAVRCGDVDVTIAAGGGEEDDSIVLSRADD